MNQYINKRLFQGFVCLHILHHAELEPIYGSWMIEELAKHGYKLSPGTLYPILHSLENENLIHSYEEIIGGKIRKYYKVTDEGKSELKQAKKFLTELIDEIDL